MGNGVGLAVGNRVVGKRDIEGTGVGLSTVGWALGLLVGSGLGARVGSWVIVGAGEGIALFVGKEVGGKVVGVELGSIEGKLLGGVEGAVVRVGACETVGALVIVGDGVGLANNFLRFSDSIK